jgi:hypothetical protein
MAGNHKTEVHENAARIIEWLLEHRTEFEQDGVEEVRLGEGVGLSEDEIREAIDHLENHEDVARLPEGLSNPPRFLLKPARGWSEIAEGREERSALAGRCNQQMIGRAAIVHLTKACSGARRANLSWLLQHRAPRPLMGSVRRCSYYALTLLSG